MNIKTPFLLVLFYALFVTACSEKEQVDPLQLIEREFVANYEPTTRTSVDNGGKVDWSRGDVINYYTVSDGSIGKCSITEDCHSAKITASVGEYDSFIVAVHGATISNPLAKSMSLSDLFSSEQDGTFENTHVSLCKRYFDDGNTLNFANISGYLHFSLKRKNVSYVLLTTEDGSKICGDGTATVTFSGDKPSVVFGQISSGNMIKVNINRSGDFYVATLPAIVKGFAMRFYDDTDQLLGIARSEKTLDLSAGNMVNLGEMDSRIAAPEREDLSAAGTANCYIASKSGFPYKFKATVKGNSNESVGEPRTAKVLWESFGTNVVPKVGDIVSEVSFDNGYINFTAGQNGNAVIQVGDADGDILWSWHIWVCDGFDPRASAQEYLKNAGIMMDRDLGATSVVRGDVHTMGLYYQWGRKDPFLGTDGIMSETIAESTATWPQPEYCDDTTNQIEISIKHPMVYYHSGYAYEWYSGKETRWSSTKTKYDPCPPGWRVPDKEVWEISITNTKEQLEEDSNNYGFVYKCTVDNTIAWYQGRKAAYYSWGRMAYWSSGCYGRCWSVTEECEGWAYYFDYGVGNMLSGRVCADGLSVRCLAE